MDEDVSLDFTADVAEAVAAVDELRDATQELAVTTEEAKTALGGMKDSSEETAASQEGLTASLAEVMAAAGAYRDEMGRLRDAQGKFMAESALMDLALGHTRDEALEAAAAMKAVKDSTGSGGGGISGFLQFLKGGKNGTAGESGGIAGMLQGIPLLGSLIEAPQLLIAIIPLVAAVVTEVGALAAGFTAAGLGIGSFAALAMPAFSQVFGAYSKIQKDQKAYNDALTATAKNTALKKLNQDYADLDPNERAALKGIQSLKTEFSNMSKAFEPTAFKVFNQLLGIANQLLPYVGQFANAAAPAIEGVLNMFSNGLKSQAFKQFMDYMKQLSGPVITAVGSGMAGLAKDVMHLLTIMSKKDVINGINIAFRLVGAALEIVIGIIEGSMHAWDQITMGIHEAANAFDVARHGIATAGHDIADAFDAVRHTVASWAHDVSADFDTVRHDAATFAHGVASTWDTVRHDVATLGHDIASGFDKVRSTLAGWVNDVKADAGKVVSWFKALPGQVMSVLASLPGKLVQYGADIVRGLIRGVESMGGTLVSAIENLIPGPIRSVVSTALGIFSPSTVFHGFGVNIVQGLINGVQATVPALRSAMGLVTGTVSGTGSVLAAGAVSPAGGTHNFNVNVTSQGGALASQYQTPEFQQYLQQQVQEAILRYGQVNVSNGLTPAWGR